jgi:hypothetical protein
MNADLVAQKISDRLTIDTLYETIRALRKRTFNIDCDGRARSHDFRRVFSIYK